MKKKIVYTDEPMGDVELVADFLFHKLPFLCANTLPQ